jgi:excisionase family DNA binding protein
MTKLLTIEEVAGALKLNKFTVHRMVNRGRLPHVRIGRCIRVKEDVLAQFVEDMTVTGGKTQ